MAVIEVTQDNFQKEILESDKPVLIDFWASWCGPCKMMTPLMEEIAEERPDVKVCKINVDTNSELSNAFRIKSIPTLALMQDGKVINSTIGVQPKSTVISMLSKVR